MVFPCRDETFRQSGKLCNAYNKNYVKEKLCNTYNKMFENHCDEMNIGKSKLLPLQKPNKEKGPLKNQLIY